MDKTMKKQLYVLLFWLIPLFGGAQISDKLTISKQDINTERVNGYDKINWKSDYRTQEIGNPELPIYRVSYVLPVDVTVTDITFTTKTKQKHEQNFNIIPVQQPILTDNSNTPAFTQPNKAVYQSALAYPNKLYDIESDGFYMGYHLITLRIYPFEYIPLTQTLNYYSQLEFTINYTAGANKNEIYPQTQSLYRAEQCKTLVQSLVRNSDDVLQFGSNVQTIRNGKNIIQNLKTTVKSSAPQKIKSLSILDEQIPDYIIITNDALKPTFQTLADWKIKKGIFTIIKTIEEIANNYSGTDLQEKIRNYIIESWSKWGSGLFVMLGGGSNIVPTRMVVGLDTSTRFATDIYYSSQSSISYVNNSYSVNKIYDFVNFVGRLPIDNEKEAKVIINKIIKYEKADLSDLSYLRNNLYSVEYMDSYANTLNTFAISNVKSYVSNGVPQYINNKYICDNASCGGSNSRYTETPSQCPAGNIELNHTNFLNSLNYGADLGVGKFHFIYQMDHGSSQGIATSGKDKGEGVSKVEMGNLSNNDSYQIFLSSACHPANFVENCVAQYYLNDSLGGGVAFMGKSCTTG